MSLTASDPDARVPEDIFSVRINSLREARESILSASSATIRGASSAQSWGAPVVPPELVLDTTGLDQIVAYNPADMTIAVGAGLPMANLQAHLAEHGQRVSLDAARIGAGATVGGLLATADGGPLRHTHGTLRDLVLGVTVVLADGSIARSGGHVVKNVAGYDLAKLLSGSLGTLGLIAEVVLRLHPLPVSTGTLAVAGDPASAFEAATTLLLSPLEPVAVEWQSLADTPGQQGAPEAGVSRGRAGAEPPQGRLLAKFEGSEASVAKRLGKASMLLGADSDVLMGQAETDAWQGVSRLCLGSEGDTVFRAGTLPALFPQVAERLARLVAELHVVADLTSSLGAGVHTIRLSQGNAEGHASVLRSLRGYVSENGGSVTLHRRIAGLDDLVPSWGTPPSNVGVFRDLKKRLDPGHRLGRGRFDPWIETPRTAGDSPASDSPAGDSPARDSTSTDGAAKGEDS